MCLRISFFKIVFLNSFYCYLDEDSFNDNDSGFDSKRSSASEQEINENEKKESPENNTSDNLVNDSFKNSSAFESPKYKNDENGKCKYSSQDIAVSFVCFWITLL